MKEISDGNGGILMSGQEQSEKWEKAKVIWVSRTIGDKEKIEVIFELDDDPDNLKQIEISEKQLQQELRKGDEIEICLDATPVLIRNN